MAPGVPRFSPSSGRSHEVETQDFLQGGQSKGTCCCFHRRVLLAGLLQRGLRCWLTAGSSESEEEQVGCFLFCQDDLRHRRWGPKINETGSSLDLQACGYPLGYFPSILPHCHGWGCSSLAAPAGPAAKALALGAVDAMECLTHHHPKQTKGAQVLGEKKAPRASGLARTAPSSPSC